MPKTFDSKCAAVVCPFFLGRDKKRIVCEGLIAGSSMGTSFASPEDCKLWLRDFCSKDYNSCPFAGLLNDKWDKILERRH